MGAGVSSPDLGANPEPPRNNVQTGPPDPGANFAQVELVPVHKIVLGTFILDYSFPGRKNGSDVSEGERHSRDIIIPPPSNDACHAITSLTVPVILLGINKIDISAAASEMELLSYVTDTHPQGFRIHLDTFGRTRLYYGAVNWMAIYSRHLSPSGSTDMQWGTADSHYSYPRKWGCRYIKQRIQFRKPFDQPPNVFSCLSGFTVGGLWCKHWDIKTLVNSIDREGFTLHIEKTRDSEKNLRDIVAAAQVSWVAFPNRKQVGGEQLACGEFHLTDGRRTATDNGKTVEWRGHARFTEGFVAIPQVFAAFTSFDVDKLQKTVSIGKLRPSSVPLFTALQLLSLLLVADSSKSIRASTENEMGTQFNSMQWLALNAN